MANKQMDGGFIARYVTDKAKMKVVIVNSAERITITVQVIFISIIGT
jgi:hypothetical protein